MSNEIKINYRDYEADTTGKDEKAILEEYKEESNKRQQELLKRYQERVESKKQERVDTKKQPSEKPKQKKSKIRRFLFKFKNEGFLSVLWYFSLILWFGFVGRTIVVSEMHIILKIAMIAGCLWWCFYTFVLHYSNTENED